MLIKGIKLRLDSEESGRIYYKFYKRMSSFRAETK